MVDNFLRFVTQVARFGAEQAPKLASGIRFFGDKASKILGKGTEGGLKGGLKFASKATEKFTNFVTSDGPGKILRGAGKFTGYAMEDFEQNVRGINNILGAATRGIEINGKRVGALIKDTDTNLLGKKFTKLGTTAIVGAAAIGSVADGTKNAIRARQGQIMGVQGNAPINNYSQDQYAYSGHSYADNAGATGDLVLNMHANRGSRIF